MVLYWLVWIEQIYAMLDFTFPGLTWLAKNVWKFFTKLLYLRCYINLVALRRCAITFASTRYIAAVNADKVQHVTRLSIKALTKLLHCAKLQQLWQSCTTTLDFNLFTSNCQRDYACLPINFRIKFCKPLYSATVKGNLTVRADVTTDLSAKCISNGLVLTTCYSRPSYSKND